MAKKKRSASGRIKSKAGLLKAYKSLPDEIQKYFEHLPKLIDDFPLSVALAYVFARHELGQNMTLYCGIVKLHRANAELARRVVNTHHLTREGFAELFKTIYDIELPQTARTNLKKAEDARDDVMHGKSVNEDRMRNAIAQVLEFAKSLNALLDKAHKIKPYVLDLRGFAGASKKLDSRTTRFMLKGMGFGIP